MLRHGDYIPVRAGGEVAMPMVNEGLQRHSAAADTI